MKKSLVTLLAIALLLSMLPSCAAPAEPVEPLANPDTVEQTVETPAPAEEETSEEVKNPFELLDVSRSLIMPQAQDGIEPYSEHWFGENRVAADLSGNPALAYSLSFSHKTSFDSMPAGYDPAALLEWGKYPGLNIDILHKHGFTGKGAVIAYVDQPVSGHEQYNTEKLHCTNNSNEHSSMHGPAVLSSGRQGYRHCA